MNWNYEYGRIYSVDDNKDVIAEVTFVYKGNTTIDIIHTYVNPIFRGQGVAGKLMEIVAQYLKEKGLQASASCSYANTWLKKYREAYSDIVSEDIYNDVHINDLKGR